ncbi:MAG: hypothetical protein GX653_07580 [Clostridiales bacterium]|nr:hypothetical protein [Clostridiales bacterium]
MQDMLLVLNFDSRYASALAMKLRAERIDCRILPGDTPVETVMAQGAMGLVLAGGVSGELPAALDGRLLSGGIPVLGMGDAALAQVQLLGGSLEEAQPVREVATVTFLPSPVTEGLGESERYLNTLRPMLLSEDMQPLAQAEGAVIGFAHGQLPLYGFAFQIEANDPDGMNILLHFAQEVCGCTAWLTDNAFISAARSEIARVVGDGKALCVLTGGLDSGVSALLAHRALGDRLHGLFIDTGLLRENEKDDFLFYYRDTLGIDIHVAEAQERFCQALEGMTDPQEKTEAITRLYRQVAEEAAADIPHDMVILGTSANDVLRTGDTCVVSPISTQKPVIEPLRELFKEEIRRIGEALGMPPDIYQAQPFPGTGLALRVVGEATRRRLAILRKADAIFREEVRQAGLNKKLWKYFVVLHHHQVSKGEGELALALRAVTISKVSGEVRAMPARLPYDLLEHYTARVLQAFPEVRRVVNDITPGSSYSEIEWH